MTEGIIGGGLETTLVTSRWSLVQFALLATYSVGFHGVTSFPYYIHKHSGKGSQLVFIGLMCIRCMLLNIQTAFSPEHAFSGIENNRAYNLYNNQN